MAGDTTTVELRPRTGVAVCSVSAGASKRGRNFLAAGLGESDSSSDAESAKTGRWALLLAATGLDFSGVFHSSMLV